MTPPWLEFRTLRLGRQEFPVAANSWLINFLAGCPAPGVNSVHRIFKTALFLIWNTPGADLKLIEPYECLKEKLQTPLRGEIPN